jgi:Dockerin type I domain/PEP-CTERM motif
MAIRNVGSRWLVVMMVMALAGVVQGQSVTDINALNVIPRAFNDFPDSTLTITDDFPTSLTINDGEFGIPSGSGFANMHKAWFAVDNGSSVDNFLFQNDLGFDISMDVNLTAGSNAPRKEAGFRFDTLIGGEGQFIVTSDGEIAAFGGPFPFASTNYERNPGEFDFGGTPYTPGDTVTLRMVYTPPDGGNPGTMQYFANGSSPGPLDFTNTEMGLIDNGYGGMYAQAAPSSSNSDDFITAVFSNFQFSDLSSAPIDGDINGDGVVNLEDLNLVKNNFGNMGSPGIPGDGNGDGMVNLTDLNLVKNNFGNGAPPAGFSAVPEPATLALLGLGGLAMIARRRSQK